MTEKIKVLALHGYLQDAETFRKKTGSLIKGLKAHCQITYIDAPFTAEVSREETAEDTGGVLEGGRSWWQWTDESSTPVRPSQAHHYTGLDVTVDHIRAALEEHKPDGIIGFSQGATATALALADLQSSQGAEASPPGQLVYGDGGLLKFAILVGAFLPRDEQAAATLAQARPALTTLFVTGEKDAHVPTERTDRLAECFSGPTSKLVHPGGHWVPTCSGDFKKQLVSFITHAIHPEP